MIKLITLVERATQGDATAFDHLVTQHWRFVYTICLSEVGYAAEAEDLTQEVFVRVCHDLADLREPAKFLPFEGSQIDGRGGDWLRWVPVQTLEAGRTADAQ